MLNLKVKKNVYVASIIFFILPFFWDQWPVKGTNLYRMREQTPSQQYKLNGTDKKCWIGQAGTLCDIDPKTML